MEKFEQLHSVVVQSSRTQSGTTLRDLPLGTKKVLEQNEDGFHQVEPATASPGFERWKNDSAISPKVVHPV